MRPLTPSIYMNLDILTWDWESRNTHGTRVGGANTPRVQGRHRCALRGLEHKYYPIREGGRAIESRLETVECRSKNN
ncbi:hypothetical protein TNIN_302401 [Trichonephila inaurata madagascariensis]|uniref:Uncharacterized protein n=1 Tax=Trichonephila inaurata madagascariensis TaxID=2747483 RepID=A0A8X6YUX1_9ARAC|nr:hypothetical protein TNIN_302401 [Trichonephila inaurata madagascariensis]